MRAKKERRGKRGGVRSAVLTGLGAGVITIFAVCLVAAMMTESGKITEGEVYLFAIFAMAAGSFIASVVTAKMDSARTGLFTALGLTAARVVTGAFSKGSMFGKTTVITIAAMVIFAFLGAALGSRRVKRRRP